MKWFVFIDTAYYPYVDDQVEADTAEEALAIVGCEPGTTVYVAPVESVTSRESPARPPLTPDEVLEAQKTLNELRAGRIQALGKIRRG